MTLLYYYKFKMGQSVLVPPNNNTVVFFHALKDSNNKTYQKKTLEDFKSLYGP